MGRWRASPNNRAVIKRWNQWNKSDSDDEEIENIKDEGIYGSDIDSDYKTFD